MPPIDVHEVHEHRIDKAQGPAAAIVRIIPSRIDAIHPAPRSVRVIVQPEKSAAPGDMEPAVVIDLERPEGWGVVAVQLANKSEELVLADRLQFLNRRVALAKQIEVSFKYRFVALGKRPRVGRRAASLHREQHALQRLIERHVPRVRAEGERHGEHMDEFGCGHAVIVAQYFLHDANRSSVRGALLARAKSLSAEYARAAIKSARGRTFVSAPSSHHRQRNSARSGTSRDPPRAARRSQRCPRWRRRDPAEYSGANQQGKIRDSPC